LNRLAAEFADSHSIFRRSIQRSPQTHNESIIMRAAPAPATPQTKNTIAIVIALLFSSAITLAFAQAPADAPKDAPKEAPKDTAKDAPKDAPARPAGQRPPGAPANAAPGAAPNAPPNAAPKTESIDVTGRRTAVTDRRDASASKIVISREDIEQYGDSNLGDVMRRLPGVTVGGRPGRPGAPGMRGMGGGFTQILINGERIAPGFSIEQITPEQVERIEILRAPTAETGARAVAGTINIILREPLRALFNEVRGGVQVERGKVSPNLSWTRNGTFSPTGTYSFTISPNHNDQLTDTVTNTDYVDIPTGNTTLRQNMFSQSHDKRTGVFSSGRLQWRLGPGEQFSIQPFLVFNKLDNESFSTLAQPIGTTPQPYATSRSSLDGEFQVARVMSMLMKRLNPETRMELRFSGGQFSSSNDIALNQFNMAGTRVLTQTINSDTSDRSWNLTGKLMRSWGEGKHSLVGGWEVEGVKRTDESRQFLNGNRVLADFGDEIDVSTRRTALYIQDEWDPTPQFSTYFGVRWEEIETKSQTTANPVDNKSRVITPLAHGVWRFAQPSRDQIRVSLTQSYRAPSTQNLVARPSLNTLFPVPGPNTLVSPDRAGNANLKPELANGVDIAYENYLEGGGIVSVNVFARDIKDLIRNVTALENVSWATSPRFVTRPQNLGKARTYGIEFDARFRLPELIEGAPAINFKTNLSLYNSKVDSVNGPNNRISEQPRVTGNFGADYRFRGTPFSVGGNVSWTQANDLQLTNNQLLKTSTKRVLEAYGLWSVTPTTRVRLTMANLTPHDLITTNIFTAGNLRETTVTNGKTALSVGLRFEMRL
jgi:outer membrane receptor for ferrienterochelin and colicins